MRHLSCCLCLLLPVVLSSACSRDPHGAVVTAEQAVTTFKAKSYIFLRLPGPSYFGVNLGHVGFGYEIWEFKGGQLAGVKYYVGSVENGGGSPLVRPGDDNDAWASRVASQQEMFSAMRRERYSSYKFSTTIFDIRALNMVEAQELTNGLSARGYNVSGNNCLNAVYDVLHALGTPGLLAPQDDWVPSHWYESNVAGWSGSRPL